MMAHAPSPFEGLPPSPGGTDGAMKCPSCRENTPDSWREVIFPEDRAGYQETLEHVPPYGFPRQVGLRWMYCANPECRELMILMHDDTRKLVGNLPERHTEAWLIRPRHAQRYVDSHVPPGTASDYREATSILDFSPRMSAVLSRRVLADVLRDYAGLKGFSLAAQIDKFIADKMHPRRLRENLHYLREIADFGAHTQRTDEDEILGVTREEAEWTLNVLDDLFDHFIVAPQRNLAVREAWDEKLDAAGRKPIALPPDDEDGDAE